MGTKRLGNKVIRCITRVVERNGDGVFCTECVKHAKPSLITGTLYQRLTKLPGYIMMTDRFIADIECECCGAENPSWIVKEQKLFKGLKAKIKTKRRVHVMSNERDQVKEAVQKIDNIINAAALINNAVKEAIEKYGVEETLTALEKVQEHYDCEIEL